MAEKFDPYHVWLGIPPEEQPPNHYRLLGVRPFEPNPDVIDNLADQRMTHLRTLQTGKNAALSQKLLNEVSAARICLLNSKTKQQYDQQLRASMPAPPPAAKPPSLPASLPVATPLAAAGHVAPPAGPGTRLAVNGPGLPAIVTTPNVSGRKPAPAQPKRFSAPLIAGIAVVVIAIVAGIGFLLMNSQGPATADRGADTNLGTSPDKTPPNAQGESAPATLKLNAPADRVNVSLFVDDLPAKFPDGDTWELRVSPGQHSLRAIRPGYMPFATTVTAAAGQRLSIDLAWQAIPKVVIKWPLSERTGGKLFIDNQERPIDAPDLEFPLSPGHHLLRIARPGFRVQNGTVELAAGDPPHSIVPVWAPVPAPVRPDPARVASVTPPPMPTPPATNTTPKPVRPPANSNTTADKSIAKSDTKPLKAPVPDDAAQAKALKNVQDIYRDQLKQAVTPDQKLALAKKLLSEGLATADDPAGRFVLLKMARDLDAAQGDLNAANEIIDRLAGDYEVAPLEMKYETLLAAAKSPLTSVEYSAKLNAFADEAVAADRFDFAKRAIVAAIKLKVDPALHKQFVAHQKEVGEVESEFHRLKASRDSLETNPDDPDANLAVGKFDCLVKGDFVNGLPLLAKGSDKTLAEFAKLDLAQSVDAAEQVQLADGWWATGKKPAQLRAKQLYEGAMPRLTGIARTKVEKRIQEFESKSGADPWTNLIKLVEPTKYVFGQWTKGANGLECTQPLYANAIEIPFDPGANYEVKVEFTRLTGTTGDIALFLPVGTGHCRVVLGAQGRYGGIDTIDGREIYDRLNPTGRPAKLENNVRCQLDVAVRTSGTAIEILVRVNGVDYTSFRGQTSQLGMSVMARLPATALTNSLGLGAQSSTAVFHSVQYRKLPPPGGR
jgi:hypothetical protein